MADEYQRVLDEGPRVAPEPETAEERLRKRRRDTVFTAGGISGVLLLVLLHVLGFIPSIGAALVFLIVVASLGLSVYRLVGRAAGAGPRTTSPFRGLVIVFFAISLVALVLAWLSGFQPNDWIVVAVPACITACLWLLDRGFVRYRGEH